MDRLKKIIVVQSLLLIVFTCASVYIGFSKFNKSSENGLLSPRVYSGLIDPKSFLIVNYEPLRSSFEDYISKNNLTISIYIENMRTGASLGIDARESYPPASLNKIITAILILKQVEDGKLSLDENIPIKDALRSSAFGTLYKTQEKEIPLRVFMEKMLKESDDTAFKVLKEYEDPQERALLISYLDYYNSNGALPGQDTETGLVSPKSMYNVFSSLYLSTLLLPDSSEYILSLLTDTSFDVKKFAKLPENVIVSQKFGSKYTKDEKYFHSCGIIYDGERRVFYCIMTKDIDLDFATQIVGAMVNKIYYYMVETQNTLDTYKNLTDWE